MNNVKTILIILISISSLFFVGCEHKTPKDYFAKNKIGAGSDYGIMKNGYDHVITIHGFLDDYDTCQDIAAMLNAEGGRYTCQPLN